MINLDPAQFAAEIVKSNVAVIDVRTPEEFSQGHIPEAINIDVMSEYFTADISTLDKNCNYAIYCRSGNRAGQAIDQMRDLGFTGELVNGGSVANASTQLGLEVVMP